MDEKRGTKRQIRFVAPRPIEAVVHPPPVFCGRSYDNPQRTTNKAKLKALSAGRKMKGARLKARGSRLKAESKYNNPQPTTNNRPPPTNKVIFLSLSFRVRLWHNGIHTGFKLCTFCTNVPFIYVYFTGACLVQFFGKDERSVFDRGG